MIQHLQLVMIQSHSESHSHIHTDSWTWLHVFPYILAQKNLFLFYLRQLLLFLCCCFFLSLGQVLETCRSDNQWPALVIWFLPYLLCWNEPAEALSLLPLKHFSLGCLKGFLNFASTSVFCPFWHTQLSADTLLPLWSPLLTFSHWNDKQLEIRFVKKRERERFKG